MSAHSLCGTVVPGWVLLACTLSAHGALISFVDRAAFEAAAGGLTTIGFEGLVPADAEQNFPNPVGLTVSGVNFLTSGTGPLGPGMVMVVGADLAMQSPWLITGAGAILVWEPPEQPGTAFLDIHLPPGVKAFATDLWTEQPVASTVQILVNSGEATEVFNIATADRPPPSFFGVISDANVILLVRISVPAGQVGLILDKVSIGDAGGGAPVPEPHTAVLLGAGLLGICVARAFPCGTLKAGAPTVLRAGQHTSHRLARLCVCHRRAAQLSGRHRELKAGGEIRSTCRHRTRRYCNNRVESDHRHMKRRLRAMQWPRTTRTAAAVIQGIEAVNMFRKGEVLGITRHNLHGQAWVFGALPGVA
jgi:hypothetical protein